MHPENLKLLARVQELRDFIEDRSREQSLPLKLNLTLTLRGPDGQIKERQEIHNTICTAGKNLLLASGGTKKYVNDYGYVCIGTNATASSASDTALGAEVARALGTTSNPTSASWKVTYTFPAGTGTGTITESALDYQNSASAAILARQVFTGIAKGASDTLQIDWTLS
jgi:hypothetical protein